MQSYLLFIEKTASLWLAQTAHMIVHVNGRTFLIFLVIWWNPAINEVSLFRKNVHYSRVFVISEDPVITKHLVNNKNIHYNGVTNLNQAEWDIHHA